MFVVEGARAIRHLLDGGWAVESLLLSTARARARPDLVDDASAAGATVYCAAQEVFDRITGFHAHRGALALARRPPARTVGEVTEGKRLALVVEGVNDHENLGALFRTAAAFGVGAVILDPLTADPLYRRSVRVSVGHVLRVPFARASSWPGDLEALRSAGWRVVALTPAGERTLDELVAGGEAVAGASGGAGGEAAAGASVRARWAVMVGAEDLGVSAPALRASDVTVRIPMAPGVDSLNVATAAAVALSRLAPMV